MRDSLSDLTVDEFIRLIGGDASVLLSDGETASAEDMAKAARNIAFEYREIADNKGVRVYIKMASDLLKAKASATLYAMCHNLITIDRHEEVRGILQLAGSRVGGMPADRLAAEVSSRLERAKSDIEELQKELTSGREDEVPDIRKEFAAQTAALMAYFKFQIDTRTMPATVYANLIARQRSEIRAKMAAMKKR